MEVEKIRNLSEDELALEERKAGEQLFRLRFQMKLGQTEGVKKLRDLRRDIARIKTIARERQLGLHASAFSRAATEGGKPESSRPAKKKPARAARKTAAKKKTASAPKTSGRATGKSAGGRTTKRAAARTGKVKKG